MNHARRPKTDLQATYRGPAGDGITHDEAMVRLRSYLKQFKNATEAAKHLGVDPGYLSMILRGKKPIQEWMALELGYVRQTAAVYYFTKAESNSAAPGQH